MINTSLENMGEARVLVEYEYLEGERQTNDHPGCPATIDILSVSIAGAVVDDPHSVFSDWQLDTWQTSILEGIGSEREMRREAMEAESFERRETFAIV